MPKTRLNLSLDQDLVDFVKLFAAQQRVTVADVVNSVPVGSQAARRERGDGTGSLRIRPSRRPWPMSRPGSRTVAPSG